MNPTPFRLLVAIILAWSPLAARAQTQVVDQLIDPVSLDLDGTTLTIIFDDLRADTSSTHFEAQHSNDIKRWTGIANSTVAPHASIDDRYSLTADDPGGLRKFYRIVGYSTTAEDTDGDGLSNAFEGTLGTLANVADSDNDGFDDGVEFANGTDPNDAASFLDLAGLPAVQFVEAGTSFIEGSADAHAVALEFDEPFSGTIAYSVNSQSTAASPADYTSLSGSVSVNGTSATISIPFVDDYEIRPPRLLILDLTPVDASAGYRLAGGSIHVVSLIDNDSYWTAVLKDDLFERDFRVRILRKTNAPSQIALVAGDEDGLPAFVDDGGSSSQSTGIVPETPQEVWPVSSSTDISTLFSFTSSLLPVELSSFTGFGGASASISAEPLDRRITVAVEATKDEHLFSRDSHFLGTYEEEITPQDPSKTYLERTCTGIFVMVKDIPPPPSVTNPLDPRN